MSGSPDVLGEFRRQLLLAQERLKNAGKALAPKHKGGEWEEYKAAHDEVLRLEREVAAGLGDEYAIPAGFSVNWDVGAPLPFLLMNDHRTFLTFYLGVPDPNWDGTYLTIKSTASEAAESLVLVEFLHCVSAKLGSPNDEVLHGHPLHGKGQDAYTAQIVVNSQWKVEVERINSVHQQYNPKRWVNLKHYVFWFHDKTFECLAESYKLELFKGSMSELLSLVYAKLLG